MKNKIYYEIQQIDLLIKTHDLLLKLCRDRDPNSTELEAAASILHSFYNGIERILIIIADDYDHEIPEDTFTNTTLLERMHAATSLRNEILSDENLDFLRKCFAFRKSLTASPLPQWNSTKDLFVFLKINWSLIKKDILNFIEKTEETPQADPGP